MKGDKEHELKNLLAACDTTIDIFGKPRDPERDPAYLGFSSALPLASEHCVAVLTRIVDLLPILEMLMDYLRFLADHEPGEAGRSADAGLKGVARAGVKILLERLPAETRLKVCEEALGELGAGKGVLKVLKSGGE